MEESRELKVQGNALPRSSWEKPTSRSAIFSQHSAQSRCYLTEDDQRLRQVQDRDKGSHAICADPVEHLDARALKAQPKARDTSCSSASPAQCTHHRSQTEERQELAEQGDSPVKETVEIEDVPEEVEDLVKKPEPDVKASLPKIAYKTAIKIRPPFPGRLAKNKEVEEMIKIFKKMEINIPLITTLTSIPRCAKFLKELCTKRVKYTDDAKFQMGKNVSAVLKRDLPIKCTDLGMFYIPCVIGETSIDLAMLDLGA